MEPLEATKARLERLEKGIQRLIAAYERALDEQKMLLLTQRRRREQLREQLLRLRQKVEVALSYGRGDSNMDHTRSATDRSGATEDNKAP
ncbi:MAG: hypothetical protein N3E49_08140 [Bacteroidia bacterium]|nr:hypothetical protein [Bacteroidia bacterium]